MRIILLTTVISVFLLFFGTKCRIKNEDVIAPLDTFLRLKTMHHDIPASDVNVFIKYNRSDFPGYDKTADFFDTLVVSNAQGIIEIGPVLPGKHWAVAFGSSEHGIALPIYGSMPFTIDPFQHPRVDTFIYMFE